MQFLFGGYSLGQPGLVMEPLSLVRNPPHAAKGRSGEGSQQEPDSSSAGELEMSKHSPQFTEAVCQMGEGRVRGQGRGFSGAQGQELKEPTQRRGAAGRLAEPRACTCGEKDSNMPVQELLSTLWFTTFWWVVKSISRSRSV